MKVKETNFTEEQVEALNEFIQETVDRKTLHDTIRRLERQIENVIGSNSSYTTERRLKNLLKSDLFKTPEHPFEGIPDHEVSSYENNQMNYEE